MTRTRMGAVHTERYRAPPSSRRTPLTRYSGPGTTVTDSGTSAVGGGGAGTTRPGAGADPGPRGLASLCAESAGSESAARVVSAAACAETWVAAHTVVTSPIAAVTARCRGQRHSHRALMATPACMHHARWRTRRR